MSTVKNTSRRIRDERGSSLIGVQMGVAVGTIVLTALAAFTSSAMASNTDVADKAYHSISTSQGAAHIQARVQDADAIVEVGYDRLVFDTRTETGTTRTFYEITESGDLLTAEVPAIDGDVYEMGEGFKSDRTLVRDLDPAASYFTGTDAMGDFSYESDTTLVGIVLDGGTHIETAAHVG